MKVQIHKHGAPSTELTDEVIKPLITALKPLSVAGGKGGQGRLRKAIKAEMKHLGWPPNAMKIDSKLKVSITSVNHGVALCMQFGNISRAFYDLMKMETFHRLKRADAGILILPTGGTAKGLGQNISNIERVDRELKLYREAGVLTMPIVLVGVQAGP